MEILNSAAMPTVHKRHSTRTIVVCRHLVRIPYTMTLILLFELLQIFGELEESVVIRFPKRKQVVHILSREEWSKTTGIPHNAEKKFLRTLQISYGISSFAPARLKFCRNNFSRFLPYLVLKALPSYFEFCTKSRTPHTDRNKIRVRVGDGQKRKIFGKDNAFGYLDQCRTNQLVKLLDLACIRQGLKIDCLTMMSERSYLASSHLRDRHTGSSQSEDARDQGLIIVDKAPPRFSLASEYGRKQDPGKRGHCDHPENLAPNALFHTLIPSAAISNAYFRRFEGLAQ